MRRLNPLLMWLLLLRLLLNRLLTLQTRLRQRRNQLRQSRLPGHHVPATILLLLRRGWEHLALVVLAPEITPLLLPRAWGAPPLPATFRVRLAHRVTDLEHLAPVVHLVRVAQVVQVALAAPVVRAVSPVPVVPVAQVVPVVHRAVAFSAQELVVAGAVPVAAPRVRSAVAEVAPNHASRSGQSGKSSSCAKPRR